jgi:RNA polymerase sigma-70 factor (ECF subfamily)
VPGLSQATQREIIRIGTELAEMMLHDRDRADDIAQLVVIDVWQDVLKDPDGFDETKPLEPYVFARVANKVVDEVRSTNSRVTSHFEYEWTREGSAEAGGSAEGRVRTEDLAKVIDRVLRRMPPRRREIWLRVKQDRQDHQLVASERGLSPDTVRSHLKHAHDDIMLAVTAHLEDR